MYGWSFGGTYQVNFTLIALLVVLIVAVLIPIQRILSRAGFSGWWCVLTVVAFVDCIALVRAVRQPQS
jgi:uncharacterized membrane protein YhaH (DUF805 family)